MFVRLLYATCQVKYWPKHTNFGIRFDGVCKYVNISTTAVQHLRIKAIDQNIHTSKYMFRVLLYNAGTAAADSLRTQTATLASPVGFVSHIY